MSWYYPLQNTIYCGKLRSTTYHIYQGDSSAASKSLARGDLVWTEPLLP